MTDIMYEVPSDKNIEKVIIDKDIVLGKKDRLSALGKKKTA